MRLGYDVLPMINGRDVVNLNGQTAGRERILLRDAPNSTQSRQRKKYEMISGTTEVIIRPVELSDEFTGRDYCNELIHFILLCGEVVLSRNCAFFLVREIAQLCGYFNVL